MLIASKLAPWQAIVLIVVGLSGLLMVLAVIFMLITMGIVLKRAQTFDLDGHKVKELVEETRFGRWVSHDYWPFAFWWMNGPIFLYQRLVKRNKKSRFNDPMGKYE